MNFLGAPVAATADGPCGDEPEHVEVGDQHRHPASGQWGFPHVVAGLVVHVVHLAGLDATSSGPLGQQDSGQDQLLLGRQRADHRRDLVGFDLGLCGADVANGHRRDAFMLGLFCGDAEQIKCTTGVAVFLRSQCSAQTDDTVFQHIGVQRA